MADTALITDIGLAKIAAAAGSASAVAISHVALGDGGGAAYEPDFTQTALQNEVIRQAIDNRAQIEPKSWLVRATFASEDVPAMSVREIGFFDGDGDLIVIVAGAGFTPRSLGGFDYILEQPLNFDRAAEGVLIVDAPDWELFDHAVLNLETEAVLIKEQFEQALELRDVKAENAALRVMAEALALAQANASTAESILAKLKAVHGAGSGLDADHLDGKDGAFFQNASNLNAGTVDIARLAIASQAQAEAGADNATLVTPLAVAQAIAALVPPAFGVGQSWQDVLGQRSADVVYQNTTGRTIGWSAELADGAQMQVSPDNVTWTTLFEADADQDRGSVGGFFAIPPNHYYRTVGGVVTWLELS